MFEASAQIAFILGPLCCNMRCMQGMKIEHEELVFRVLESRQQLLKLPYENKRPDTSKSQRL